MTNTENNLYLTEKKNGDWQISDPMKVLATQPSVEHVSVPLK